MIFAAAARPKSHFEGMRSGIRLGAINKLMRSEPLPGAGWRYFKIYPSSVVARQCTRDTIQLFNEEAGLLPFEEPYIERFA